MLLIAFICRVTERNEDITTIEWDNKGTKLLIGDENGNIEIWSMRDFLISDWQCVYSHSFSGDCILAGIWFHKGIKLIINHEKKDLNVSYQEKFNYSKIGASVVQFGSMHTDGYLCITSTGLVYAHLFCSNGKVITGYDFLNNSRMKISKIDISYMKNGTFLVITSNGNSKMPMSCFTINITVNMSEKQNLKITCKSYISFTLNSILFSNLYPTISQLKFTVKEVPDAVLVVASGNAGSIIELWELREKPVSINSIIQNVIHQKHLNTEFPANYLTWQFTSNTVSSAYVSALATPRSSLFETSPPMTYIIVSYTDKTIKCFYRENLQLLISVNLSTTLTQNPTSALANASKLYQPKNMLHSKRSTLSIIRNIQLTWSNCAMVAIDSYFQLHFFRLPPVIDPSQPMTLNYAQLMLEYSLISGNDYWDILINIKPLFVDILCEKVTESFITKQIPSIQQKWMDNVLQLKAALYRCFNSSISINNSCKSGDFYSMKMLNAISETIKRLIRAREFQENEGPAEKLSFLIQNKTIDAQFLNVDKILLKLDNKDFCVEPVIQQAFQHLLQWVCDLALYLLASIPQQFLQNKYRLPGVCLTFLLIKRFVLIKTFIFTRLD